MATDKEQDIEKIQIIISKHLNDLTADKVKELANQLEKGINPTWDSINNKNK